MGFGERRKRPQARIAGETLVERTDNGRKGKLLERHSCTTTGWLCANATTPGDRPKITPGNVGSGIAVVAIHVVDVPKDGGELNDPWTSRGESREGEPMDGQHQDP